jgi:uncharacterized membrane protein YecN with MAPEG domain
MISSTFSASFTNFASNKVFNACRILLEALVITVHMWLTGMLVNGIRSKLFNRAFYEKNFPSWKGRVQSSNGLPDMGQGRISDKLSDEEWVQFNNYQRSHYNYLEGIALVVPALLIAGLFQTKITFILGVVYIVGRELYSQGYKTFGASKRGLGAATLDIALVGLWGISIYYTFQAGGGMHGFKAFLFN